MDRRGFLRRGGVAAAVVAVAPLVAVKAIEPAVVPVTLSPRRLGGWIAVKARRKGMTVLTNGWWYHNSEIDLMRAAGKELERKIWFDEM